MYGELKNKDHREFVLLAHRDAGKSHMLTTKVLETVKNNKNLSINIFSGTGKQARAIFNTKLAKISADAPKEFVPKYLSAEEAYIVNDCNIALNGGTTGTADNQRGRDYDLCLLDEAMAIPEIEYLYKSVILPRILTGTGLCIWLSSAPKTPAHFFAKKIAEARKSGFLREFTLADNPRFDKDDFKRIADGFGGEDSTTFRREMMCEIITDEDAAVIPELIKDKGLTPTLPALTPADIGDNPIYAALAYHDIGESSIISFTILENRIHIIGESSTKNISARILEDLLIRHPVESFGKRYSMVLSNLSKKDALALSRVTNVAVYSTDYPDAIDRVKFARTALNAKRVIFNGSPNTAQNLSDAIYNDAKNDLFEGLFSLTEAFTVLCERFGSSANHDVYRRQRFNTGADYFI